VAWLDKTEFTIPAVFDNPEYANGPTKVNPYVHWIDPTHLIIIWGVSNYSGNAVRPSSLYAWHGLVDSVTGDVALDVGGPAYVGPFARDEFITSVQALPGGGYVVYTSLAGET
jgi:hypothetical protein